MTALGVVLMDESLSIVPGISRTTVAVTTRVYATSQLHAEPRLYTSNAVSGNSIFVLVSKKPISVGVIPRKVEEVDTREYDKKAAQQRYSVDGIGGVKPLKEDKRSTQCARREGNVIKGVDTA